ncbi:MAG: LCP family protein, partial [Butyricicoccus sp.]|nr:LCP family protein [Butyricicoccus sp.]
MKIFGGGGSRRAQNVAKPAKPQKAAKKAVKVKKPLSTAKQILIGFLIVILAMVTAGAVWAATNIKPPSLADEHVNDSTINDPENGDDPTANLNMGDRIDDFFTFVVCATDIDETRTDNIMVVAFDTNAHTVNVMNVPRDTMSNVNKTGANRKINAAYGTKDGIEQTKKQIKQVMGFTPDKFMVVNFNGIAEIVDAIGGVDYEIPFPMMYSDPVQKLEINFPEAGMRHLNGEEVVEFLRWRKNGSGYTQYVPQEYKNGDETRIAKQQEFLMYLAKQVLTPKNAFKVKDIASAVFNNVKTDITAGEMLWLAGQAFQVDTSTGIQMFTLPGYSAMSTAGNSTELSFYFIYENKALELINKYFNPYDKPITSLDLVSGPTKGSSSKSNDNDDDRSSSRYSSNDDEDDDRYTSSGNSSRNDTDDDDDSGSSGGSSGNNSGGDSDNSGGSSGGTSGGSSGGSSGGDSGNSGGSSGGDSGSTGGSSGGDSGSSGGSSGGDSGNS